MLLKKKLFCICMTFLILFFVSCGVSEKQKFISQLRLSVTPSIYNSGLLAVLLPAFKEEYKVDVIVTQAYTQESMRLALQGKLDIIMVDNIDYEKEFVTNKFGVNSKNIMYNEFIIVGPSNDPAGIKGEGVIKSFIKIARNRSLFVAPAKDSGAKRREEQIWSFAHISPKGNWYLQINDKEKNIPLFFANEKNAYCLVDKANFLMYKDRIGLEILCEKDRLLFNPYTVLAINAQKIENVNYMYALTFIDWIDSLKAKKIIKEYKIYDEPLFYLIEEKLYKKYIENFKDMNKD